MKQTNDEHDKKHCSCCGRYLINPKHTTMRKQFCHKCGIVHLGNILSNEPNKYFEQRYAKCLVDVEKIIRKADILQSEYDKIMMKIAKLKGKK